jgi:hypothetical protein
LFIHRFSVVQKWLTPAKTAAAARKFAGTALAGELKALRRLTFLLAEMKLTC